MLASKRNSIRNRIKRFRARLAKTWRGFEAYWNPPKEFFEKQFDEQLKFVNEVEEAQDYIFTNHEPEPKLSVEELIEINTDKTMGELQKWSPLVLYQHSKRLEKLTVRLMVLTVILAILTFVLIILTIHPV